MTLTLPATPGWWLALHAATRDLGVPMDWERRRDVVTVQLGDVDELAVRIAVETRGITRYEVRGG
ncbi:hypothetical protein [Cellulomonas denverensis]|uniref:Uncharacterized protein n=1 Tax=Cellulomonas denverensis TaxID=264297 RepID=A0A7X6KUT5_9CELL|nr:hypothetical protein [Cellulomonas denverensis]NKY22205.1 hypothetical protein [Cellulomonas denverensis]GIG27169.1 hypothetical protein Cde04nite_34130 [Cellulomonas denverensis]